MCADLTGARVLGLRCRPRPLFAGRAAEDCPCCRCLDFGRIGTCSLLWYSDRTKHLGDGRRAPGLHGERASSSLGHGLVSSVAGHLGIRSSHHVRLHASGLDFCPLALCPESAKPRHGSWHDAGIPFRVARSLGASFQYPPANGETMTELLALFFVGCVIVLIGLSALFRMPKIDAGNWQFPEM